MISGLEPGQSYEVRVIAMSKEQPDVPLAVGPESVVNTLGGEEVTTVESTTQGNLVS